MPTLATIIGLNESIVLQQVHYWLKIKEKNQNKAGFDKTKWYTIDYKAYESMLLSCGQNGHIVRPKRPIGSGQNDQTNTKDYSMTTTKTSLKVLHGATPKRSTPFDWSILEKQILGACNRAASEDPQPYIDIIEYYYQAYMNTFHKEHPRLSNNAMDSVVSAIQCGTDLIEDDRLNVDMYRAMIDKHFQTQYKNCNYSICHFMTDGIRNNRFYETGY